MRALTLVLNVFLLILALVYGDGYREAATVRTFSIVISVVLIVTFFLTKNDDWIEKMVNRFFSRY